MVLVNPAAGRGRGARLGEPLAERFREAGIHATVQAGRDAAEAEELAVAAVERGVDALVVAGGDGMAQIALRAVAGGTTPLGIIPTGTGNDLARELGLPRTDPLAAADIVIAGHIRTIDLGKAADPGKTGTRWFSTIACAGFDSRVAERVSAMRWPRGRRRYDLATIAELRVFRPLPFTLELDGEQWQTDAMLVAVGNTASYGGGLRICEGADPADGQFRITVVAPMSIPELVRLFRMHSKGTHADHPAVHTRLAKQVTVATPGITAYADGERVGALPLTFECVPAALPVFVPPPR